jgi:hypothetical protein
MTPMFVLAERYADATRPRVVENAQPDAPVRPGRRRRVWSPGRRRERRAEPE